MAFENLPPAETGDGANRTPLYHPAGPVAGGDVALAPAAIEAFLAELRLGEADVRHERDAGADAGGRFGYRITRGRRSCLVLVPGLPVERVRYLRAPGQNVWDFPRLYVDGHSWHWTFALKKVAAALGR